MSETPKSCPFCEGEAKWLKESEVSFGEPFGLVVKHVPGCFLSMQVDWSNPLAAWNTRVDDHPRDTSAVAVGETGVGDQQAEPVDLMQKWATVADKALMASYEVVSTPDRTAAMREGARIMREAAAEEAAEYAEVYSAHSEKQKGAENRASTFDNMALAGRELMGIIRKLDIDQIIKDAK